MASLMSNMMQDKNATFGKAVVIINTVKTSFETSRTADSFTDLWQSIRQFANENNVTIEIPYQVRGKRKRNEPIHLNNFILTTSTSAAAEPIDSIESVHDYYRSNIHNKILDSIIVNLKKRFSPDSLTLTVSMDKFMQLQYEGSFKKINYLLSGIKTKQN